jgi:hypothetical protein
MNKQNLLEKFVIKELDKVKDLFIIQLSENSYMLFNKFIITKEKRLYVIKNLGNSHIVKFYQLKHATTWCIFENFKLYNEALDIENLDRKIENHTASMEYHKKLSQKTKDPQQKILYLIKLNEDIFLKKACVEEMEKHINISKYWLNKRYKESLS